MIDQAEALTVTPTDAELERAIASVPGVVTARIERPQDTGRSRMRLRLAPGEDEEAVAWAVAATLRERFGIALDPDAIRPRRTEVSRPSDDPVQIIHSTEEADVPSKPAAEGSSELAETRERLERAAAAALDGPTPRLDEPTGQTRGQQASTDVLRLVGTADASPNVRREIPRASIEDVEIRRDTHAVEVTVTLEHDGRSVAGHVTSVPTSHGTLRAVAEATIAALRALTEGSLLVGIDRVSVRDDDDDGSTATVVVSLLTRRGEERLLGASLVRDDPERAVTRATLDALNRRVIPLLLERSAELDPAD